MADFILAAIVISALTILLYHMFFREPNKQDDTATITICDHIIKASQIVGIGPLMVQRSGDQALHMLYNSKKLSFWLHMKDHSIRIESDWCAFQGYKSEVLEADRIKYDRFWKDYDKSKETIVQMLTGNKGSTIKISGTVPSSKTIKSS